MTMATKRTRVSAWGGGATNSMATNFGPTATSTGRTASSFGAPASAFSGSTASFSPTGQFIAAPAPAASAAPRIAQAPPLLDSTASNALARWQAGVAQQQQQLKTEGEQDDQDYATAMQRSARARAIDLLDTNHAANNQGLFYSGQLTKRRDDVDHDYNDRDGDARSAYERRVAARTKALQDLGSISDDPNAALGFNATGNAGLDLSDILNGAVVRRDAANTQLGDQTTYPTAPSAPSPMDQFRQQIASGTSVKTTYTNAQGHPVRVLANGTKQVSTDGGKTWRAA